MQAVAGAGEREQIRVAEEMNGTGANEFSFFRIYVAKREEHPWSFGELWVQVGSYFEKELEREGGEVVGFAGTKGPRLGRH